MDVVTLAVLDDRQFQRGEIVQLAHKGGNRRAAGEHGSRALGQAKIDLFLKALTGFQDKLCDTINRQAIPQLMRYNGWMDKDKYPTVSLPAVREYDLNMLGNFAAQLSGIGAFHATPADEEWFRKISDLVDIPLDELETIHADAAQAEADAAQAKIDAMARSQQAQTQQQDAPAMDATNGKMTEEDISAMEPVNG